MPSCLKQSACMPRQLWTVRNCCGPFSIIPTVQGSSRFIQMPLYNYDYVIIHQDFKIRNWRGLQWWQCKARVNIFDHFYLELFTNPICYHSVLAIFMTDDCMLCMPWMCSKIMLKLKSNFSHLQNCVSGLWTEWLEMWCILLYVSCVHMSLLSVNLLLLICIVLMISILIFWVTHFHDLVTLTQWLEISRMVFHKHNLVSY